MNKYKPTIDRSKTPLRDCSMVSLGGNELLEIYIYAIYKTHPPFHTTLTHTHADCTLGQHRIPDSIHIKHPHKRLKAWRSKPPYSVHKCFLSRYDKIVSIFNASSVEDKQKKMHGTFRWFNWRLQEFPPSKIDKSKLRCSESYGTVLFKSN